MNFVDTNICVGGPLDGQCYSAPREARYFRAYERLKLPSILDFDPSKPVRIEESTIKQVEYRRQCISGYTFFAPTDQKPEETIRLLLEKYAT